MRTSEVLDGAADHIEAFGWCQGALSADWVNPRTSPACAVGGILVGNLMTEAAYATAALQDYLGVEYVPDWNDAPERTQAEVVATLRAVAVIVAAKESQGVEAVGVSV